MEASRFKAIIASVFLTFGTIHNIAESAPTEQKAFPHLQIIHNGVNKMDVLFAKLIKDGLKPEENALFSPLNIYTALSLLHLGTNGETRNELGNVLGIPSDEAGLDATHNQLGKLLNDLQTTDAAEVKIANSVFAQKELQLKESYLQAAKKYYKEETHRVDFCNAGSEAIRTINNWVSNNTKTRIPQLFKKPLARNTVLLLGSVLFFNASWEHSFDEWSTKNEKFNTGIKEVMVPTMNNEGFIPYMHNDELEIEAIKLPYRKGEFSMVIVLPYRNSSVGTFVGKLKPKHRLKVLREFSSSKYDYNLVAYKVPRFKFDWSQNINNYIEKLGITKIFSRSSEFENLVENAGDLDLQVSNINHAAEIQVNEGGTVATAATTIEIATRMDSSPSPSVYFFVDRPFVVSIFHEKTGLILFTGIVQNPA